jgi:hypothetical protein
VQTIRISKKLTAAFGLTWHQHDELEYSKHTQIQRWLQEGYTHGASYKHDGGRVYGLHKANGKEIPNSDCISGAATIATHPAIAGKTGFVLIEFRVQEDQAPAVIFVALRAGVVMMDLIIQYSEIPEYRNRFHRAFLTTGDEAPTWGDLSAPHTVDFDFGLEDLIPGPKAGSAHPLSQLRSARMWVILGSISVVIALLGMGYAAWQYNIERTAELKRRLEKERNTPAVIYGESIARWEKRPVIFLAPSLAYLHKELASFQPIRAGFQLLTISCDPTACTSIWDRQEGTLEAFRATAPANFLSVTPIGQERLEVALDLKLPVAKIDRATWPKTLELRDRLITQWQSLQSAGWAAAFGNIERMAVPPAFTKEQLAAIAAYPNPPLGVSIAVTNAPWWFTNDDPLSPVALNRIGEQVELVDPIEVKYDGKEFIFSFKGMAYVQN